MSSITLRPVDVSDIPHFVAIQTRPESIVLGPRDLVTTDDADPGISWRAAMTDRSKVIRTAERDGVVAGYVMVHDTGQRFPPLAFAVESAQDGLETAIDAVRAFLAGFPRRPVRTWVDTSSQKTIEVLEALAFDRLGERVVTRDDGESVTEAHYELALFPRGASGGTS